MKGEDRIVETVNPVVGRPGVAHTDHRVALVEGECFGLGRKQEAKKKKERDRAHVEAYGVLLLAQAVEWSLAGTTESSGLFQENPR